MYIVNLFFCGPQLPACHLLRTAQRCVQAHARTKAEVDELGRCSARLRQYNSISRWPVTGRHLVRVVIGPDSSPAHGRVSWCYCIPKLAALHAAKEFTSHVSLLLPVGYLRVLLRPSKWSTCKYQFRLCHLLS